MGLTLFIHAGLLVVVVLMGFRVYETLNPKPVFCSRGLAAFPVVMHTKQPGSTHPPHNLDSVPVLATSSATQCTSARHVIYHTVYRFLPCQPPPDVPVIPTSSAT